MELSFAAIAAALDTVGRSGDFSFPVRGIAYDSRVVKEGYVFFALPGLHADGHDFIAKAVGAGARGIVHEKEIAPIPGVACARVRDARAALSPAAAAFYGHPSRSLRVVGVTGTEGKSTTVSLAWQLLNLADLRAGFFSTVTSDSGGGEVPNPEHQTTPEATAVHRMLAAMRDSGLGYAVVESSSHGLSPRTSRLADVDFDVAVMTNVTHEHLEFHGTWEQYRSDKANLFRALDKGDHMKTTGGKSAGVAPWGIANADDPSVEYFASATAAPTLTYGKGSRDADLHASDIVSDAAGSGFMLTGPADWPPARPVMAGGMRGERIVLPARINLPGDFNVGNAMAACLAAACVSGRHWREFVPLFPRLVPIRGRMSSIDRGQPFRVIVDYAHTPSSFATVLPPLRASVAGRIICLFGSAGERDTEKRPQQGRIAADNCDVLILADEDPRGEDPMAILEQIAAGCPELPRGERLFLIPDRGAAIRKAFSLAREGDLVILLGKGHENSIIRADRAEPYDESAEAIRALAESGFVG